MIIPILSGITQFKNAPVTWLILLLQVVLFAAMEIRDRNANENMGDLYEDSVFLDQQGQYYSQFILSQPHRYPSSLIQGLEKRVKEGSQERSMYLGSLAFRDSEFLSQIDEFPFKGDQLALSEWRSELKKNLSPRREVAAHQFGLSLENEGVMSWFTYQFVHGSWLHLLSNMWFLLIIGCFLEPMIGGLAFGMLFLICGVGGAIGYTLLTGLSAAPLIGASGAVSGVIGFASVLYGSRNARFWYWVLPHVEYTGFVYLPFWVLCAFWLVSDLAGFWSSISEFGGIAHSAHLGGFLVGCLAAAILSAKRSLKSSYRL